ncbi:MAG: DUF1003 domain-containing protein [Hyphomicrobiaceae bacterium]|nr:DUF1003 domain-containing protein [Hyphomicrobiaceae bacterium]
MPQNNDHHGDHARSAISGRSFRPRDLVALETVRPSLAVRILADHPNLQPGALVSREDLAHYRLLVVQELLLKEHGEIDELDRAVAESMSREASLVANVQNQFASQRTFGERLSDRMASFGGSWTFIVLFAAVLGSWIVLNIAEGGQAFDPYPFILLNLVLSCLAAIQAPIIMMSQQRQEAKDRLRALNDYQVNLKAELEIRHLHEKIDHLTSKQWQRLLEIQQMQLDMMEDRGRR